MVMIYQVSSVTSGAVVGKLSGAAKPNETDPQKFYAQINQLWLQGEFQKSIEELKKFLIANPNDASTHYSLGKAYIFINNDFKSALPELQKALQLMPNSEVFKVELLMAELQCSIRERGIFDKIGAQLKSLPQTPLTFAALGYCYECKAKFEITNSAVQINEIKKVEGAYIVPALQEINNTAYQNYLWYKGLVYDLANNFYEIFHPQSEANAKREGILAQAVQCGFPTAESKYVQVKVSNAILKKDYEAAFQVIRKSFDNNRFQPLSDYINVLRNIRDTQQVVQYVDKEGRAYFEKAIQFSPNDLSFRTGIARFYLRLSDKLMKEGNPARVQEFALNAQTILKPAVEAFEKEPALNEDVYKRLGAKAGLVYFLNAWAFKRLGNLAQANIYYDKALNCPEIINMKKIGSFESLKEEIIRNRGEK